MRIKWHAFKSTTAACVIGATWPVGITKLKDFFLTLTLLFEQIEAHCWWN
jgi:hypothetical protein